LTIDGSYPVRSEPAGYVFPVWPGVRCWYRSKSVLALPHRRTGSKSAHARTPVIKANYLA
jgi:hypothetical protein